MRMIFALFAGYDNMNVIQISSLWNIYEAWYNVNVWGPIIDRAYDDIANIDIVR